MGRTKQERKQLRKAQAKKRKSRHCVPLYARKTSIKAKMCSNKIRYSSQYLAIEHCIAITRYTKPLVPYKCPICGGWHLTSKEK